jgi:hypothetical protein
MPPVTHSNRFFLFLSYSLPPHLHHHFYEARARAPSAPRARVPVTGVIPGLSRNVIERSFGVLKQK